MIKPFKQWRGGRVRAHLYVSLLGAVSVMTLCGVDRGYAEEPAAQDAAPYAQSLNMRWLSDKDAALLAAPSEEVAKPVAPAASYDDTADIVNSRAQEPSIADADASNIHEAAKIIDADMDAPYDGGAVIPRPSPDEPAAAQVIAPLAPAIDDTAAAQENTEKEWLDAHSPDEEQFVSLDDIDPALLAGEGEMPTDMDMNGLYSILAHTHKTNPVLKAQREQLRLAYEQVFEAESGWLPNVQTDASVESAFNNVEPGGSSDNTAKRVSVSVSQPVYRSGRTVNASSRETLTSQAAYHDYLAEIQSVLLQTITAYIDVVAAKSQVDLNKGNVERLSEENMATSQQFEVGQLTKTDVSQSDARLARGRSDIIRAEGELKGQLAVFKQVSGLSLNIEDFEFPDQTEIKTPDSLESAIRTGLRDHPSMAAANYRIKSSQANISASYSELLPEVSLNGALEKGYDPHPGLLDEQSSATLSLSATIPFYDAGVSRSRVRQSKINKYVETNNRESVARAVRQTVTTAWEDYITAKAVLESGMVQVEAARIAREGVYREREVGARTVLDALDADQELLDAEVALINARRDLLVSEFSLLAATGRLLPENLGFNRIITPQDNENYVRDASRDFFSTDVKPMDK